jgi:hypothetical protein
MNISELITLLQEEKEKNGDKPVYFELKKLKKPNAPGEILHFQSIYSQKIGEQTSCIHVEIY